MENLIIASCPTATRSISVGETRAPLLIRLLGNNIDYPRAWADDAADSVNLQSCDNSGFGRSDQGPGNNILQCVSTLKVVANIDLNISKL